MDNNVRILPPGARQPRPSRFGGFLPLLMGLLYGISPIDLIPDLIPLLGWSDDLVAMLIAVTVAIRYWRNRKLAANGQTR